MPGVRRVARSPKPAEEYQEEEPEEPRSSRRRPNREEAETNGGGRRPRRPREEEDDEEGDDGKSIRTGWGGYKTTKENAPSKWAKLYKPPEDGEGLIKFLEDGPYASFLQHWCEWMPQGQKKSYICLGVDTDCPVCEVDTPSPRVRFNILDLDGDEPVLKVWETGVTITDTILKYAMDKKVGPLSRDDMYYGVQMSGGKKKSTSIRPIKSRDVEDDWEYELLTDEEIGKFLDRLWTEETLDRSTRKELQKVAAAAAE